MNGTSTIRWLYDLEIGGKPAAFKCLLCPDVTMKNLKVHTGMVTRTLSGRRAHQKAVHGFVAQKRLEFTKADLAVQAGESR